jgi:aminoglycoside 6'-N-acetyltransferase
MTAYAFRPMSTVDLPTIQRRLGTPHVVIDADPANARAIRAYEKAGFCHDRIVDAPDGPTLLMVRDR